jgi:molecular chaperone DnaK (HSP70)
MSDADRQERARFIVGIDLGTTNTVVAFADTREALQARPQIETFGVPQLVAAGEVAARAQLPSFRYHPAQDELADADLELGFAAPLPELPRAVIGVLAQTLGSRVPGRLIASAKSWLCHAGVDRQAAILPWGAPEDVPKVSPVDAGASYLAHVCAAWDAAHPDALLAAQEIVLTVPASFDEAARALTLQAAQRAGLPRVRLLEEPQAAFYDWLDREQEQPGTQPEADAALSTPRLVLVIDAGGGTTDLTLIRAEVAPSGQPRFTRIAVGDHLLLGGDNMDHALAHLCEPALRGAGEARLPAARFAQLLQQCRQAKQTLLGSDAPEQVNVTLLGSGSKVVGGNVRTTLSRVQVEHALVDGFFAHVALDARPETRRSGLVEFGLPFVADAVVTRHVAAFLARHRAAAADALGIAPEDAEREPRRALPDAVLFNGGVFRSRALETRMLEVLAELRGEALVQLANPHPDLAVARGAVAYGLARRGLGAKIGGGSPRSYYLHVTSEQREHDAVCVLPRGAEEGEAYALTDGTFALRVGKPVRFALFTSTAERAHRAGDLVRTDDGYDALPDLVAVIEGMPGDGDELQVELQAQLTEVGTLEMSLVSTANAARRYRLEFQLRGEQRDRTSTAPARVGQLHPRLREATDVLQVFFGKAQKQVEGRKINTLRSDLEKILGDRSRWEPPLLRELFATLLAGSKHRRRSADHERLWFHLTGFCLRPGFGYPVDAWRVEQVYPLYEQGVQFAPDAAVWAQFWVLWRRISGGLDDAQQNRILDDVAFYLDPNAQRRGAKPKGPRALGLEEMVRLAASFERIDAARKVELGAWLFARVQAKTLSHAAAYWSLGRIGARAPWYGSAHTVVPPEVAASWLDRLLALDLATTEQAAFAITQLARFTHDRARDLSPELREHAALALAKLRGSERWVQLVREGGELSASEATQVFGESLPPGLRLL